MIVPWFPLGVIPPGHGSAGSENDAHITYPSAGAVIGYPYGILKSIPPCPS